MQLKRRQDLVPNLVNTVSGYATHERTLFTEITNLRNKCLGSNALPDRLSVENQMSGLLSRIIGVAENYPDLKASISFVELQKTLADIEDQIQLARRYYNGSVKNLNILVESFPSI